jgi:hypothetical protein
MVYIGYLLERDLISTSKFAVGLPLLSSVFLRHRKKRALAVSRSPGNASDVAGQPVAKSKSEIRNDSRRFPMENVITTQDVVVEVEEVESYEPMLLQGPNVD